MKKYLFLFCGILMLGGCTAFRPAYDWNNVEVLEPIVLPSFSANYLLSCMNDMQDLQRKEFEDSFQVAEESLVHGRNLDKLRFICLSLNERADYKQFQRGKEVFEKYLEDSPDSGEDLQGFRVLIDRLDDEILTRWSAWKSLLYDKKELMAEIESLTVKINAQEKQIEELKNIENIIKSRGTSQP